MDQYNIAVPFVVHQAAMARAERMIKRLSLALAAVSVTALTVCLIAFIA